MTTMIVRPGARGPWPGRRFRTRAGECVTVDDTTVHAVLVGAAPDGLLQFGTDTLYAHTDDGVRVLCRPDDLAMEILGW